MTGTTAFISTGTPSAAMRMRSRRGCATGCTTSMGAPPTSRSWAPSGSPACGRANRRRLARSTTGPTDEPRDPPVGRPRGRLLPPHATRGSIRARTRPSIPCHGNRRRETSLPAPSLSSDGIKRTRFPPRGRTRAIRASARHACPLHANGPHDHAGRTSGLPSHGNSDDTLVTESAFSKSEMMIVAAARALEGQHVCFVGVGLPNIAVNLAQRTVAPDLELVYEAGVFGARPARLPLSIGDPTIVTGATAATSMFELFAFYLQGGLIDVGFLGAAQIDR